MPCHAQYDPFPDPPVAAEGDLAGAILLTVETGLRKTESEHDKLHAQPASVRKTENWPEGNEPVLGRPQTSAETHEPPASNH